MPTESPSTARALLVADGVWWLRGVRGSNVYLIRDAAGRHALIDAGSPGSAPQTLEALATLGVDEVDALLLTHRHWDHMGGAAELQRCLGLRVYIGAGDVHGATHTMRPPLPARFARARFARRFAGAKPPRVDAAIPMDRDTEVIPGVLAIPSPGHTDGSTCFLLPDRDTMFVGDVALRSEGRMSRPLPYSNDDTQAQERSLTAIAARAPANGCPGHGTPVIGHFDEWMRTLAARPPAPGPAALRILRNPRMLARFARGLFHTR